MMFHQSIFIFFVVITINSINSSALTVESRTTQSIYHQAATEILKLQDDLKRDQEQLKVDREKFEEKKKEMQKDIENIDVIRLNVGGQIIMTTRHTLTRFPKSILSIMFNGRWEHKLPMEENVNIFLDFNPILFRHLLDQLQILNTNTLINFSPPSKLSLIEPFQKMLRKLGLIELLSLEKNIITFNVGGHVVTNRRTTFTQLSNSTLDTIVSSSKASKFDNSSDVFLDYDPKLFRHLVNRLRENPPKNMCCLIAPSSEEDISFTRMMNDLSIYQRLSSMSIRMNTTWIQNGTTIAGGNGQGNQLNQLYQPHGIYVDNDDQSIYIADYSNHRIVQWKWGAENGQVIAGGNGQGNRTDQVNSPTDAIIDKKNDSIIVCDWGNRRVVRWPRRNGINGQIIISDIDCVCLRMDNNGDLYVSDWKKNEVRRWRIGDTNGIIVAGGNGKGALLNQLNYTGYIFVDQNYSVYVSDRDNHRVMKWTKGAEEGIVVAGGQGKGNSLAQLNLPLGVTVDHSGNVYVADQLNHRIMRWSKGSVNGSIVVGESGLGKKSNQLNNPVGLSFDRRGNLYVADANNHRVQKFDIDLY